MAAAAGTAGTGVEKYCGLPLILVTLYNTPPIPTVDTKQVYLLMESSPLPSEASISP